MRYLRPIAFIASITLFFMFMNYQIILHKSMWKLALPVRVSMLLLALFIVGVFFAEVWSIANKSLKASVTSKIFTGYTIVFILLMIINPFNFPNLPTVKHSGYWQGSTSSGRITLYNDKIFEIEWNGLLRGGKYVGAWTQEKDTFYLEYNDRELDRVGNKLVYDHASLIPVDGISGLLLREVKFKCVE